MILKKVVKRRNKEKTKARILQAASDIIARDGVAGAGVNAIAKQAGANKVLLYRYFNGWNGLIEGLYGDILEGINEQVADVTPTDLSTVFEHYVRQYNQTLRTNVAFQMLIRWQIDNQLTELGSRLAALQEQFLQQIATETTVEFGLVRILMAGITHMGLMKASENEASTLSEQDIRLFCARLAPIEQAVNS